jgi:hypothetical protein
MKLPRRRFMQLGMGAAALPAVSRIARAHRHVRLFIRAANFKADFERAVQLRGKIP